MVSKALAKYIRSLHQRKYRQRHAAFLVEGAKSVLELLGSGLEIEHLLATPAFAPQLAGPRALPVQLATEDELAQLGTLQTNAAALAVVRRPPESELPLALPARRLVLALDNVADPGNLGTLWRLADWYGLPGVVLSENCADPFNPKAVAASMGAFGRVPVWADVNLAAWLSGMPTSIGIYGADLEGDNVHKLHLQPAGVLVMGSESHGLSPAVAASLTQRLHIPHGPGGRAESLNVAVSAAILLDNFFRNE
ncbi:RNA methyltransferase [Hymenobacter sp. BRD128]|uniref:TrmH family RNA methyltransferase n=1 Tax=Hymenobacter sp. BRD128 TaxID=2675878 RepID=UPI0015665A82|nr:RNA methyltransferase [Hymenobacter sp. BRD128]QKG56365.1 RNA methyltransferase [Hymenobacter sp. BRD128]